MSWGQELYEKGYKEGQTTMLRTLLPDLERIFLNGELDDLGFFIIEQQKELISK